MSGNSHIPKLENSVFTPVFFHLAPSLLLMHKKSVYTCTSCNSRILLVRSSINEYDPYFAKWPGESILASPPNTNGLGGSFANSCCWHLFHTDKIVGMSNTRCILLYVRIAMEGIFRWFRNVNNLENWDPEKRHEAAMNKFPRGIRLWTGCDDQLI